eukprot:15470930-Alexandrium_andersonii.AAC.1
MPPRICFQKGSLVLAVRQVASADSLHLQGIGSRGRQQAARKVEAAMTFVRPSVAQGSWSLRARVFYDF